MDANTLRKIRSAAKKLKIVEMHGGKCVHCKYGNKHLLQFHHIDGATKLFNIGRNDYRLSRLITEANKCILLCGNCHVLEHCSNEVKNTVDRKRKNAMLDYCRKYSCSKCGIDKSPAILEFHHVDGNKEFNLNEYRGSYKHLPEYLKSELDKCIVLCRNCHFEEHFDFEFHATVEDLTYSFNLTEQNSIEYDDVLRLHLEGKNVTVISNLLSVNKSTISTILHRLGKGSYKIEDIMVNRDLIMGYIIAGKNNTEIANILKCSASTISRVRKKLISKEN